MVESMTLDHTDQARRRRRGRVPQTAIARILGIALSKVSEYEVHGKPLPWELTPEDYERALQQALSERKRR